MSRYTSTPSRRSWPKKPSRCVTGGSRSPLTEPWCPAARGPARRFIPATKSKSCESCKGANPGEHMTSNQDPSDALVIAGRTFRSRLFLGTAGYPNRKILLDAVAASKTEMVTASIRRISLAGDDESLIDLLANRLHFLPNTAGCQTARDAVLTAELAREAL